jgi:hypothetical protein
MGWSWATGRSYRGFDALVQRGRVDLGNGRQQPRICRPGNNRRSSQQLASVRRESRHARGHDVRNAPGDFAGPDAQYLFDVERHAAGQVQLVSVGVTGHLVHRLGRQRGKRHSPRRAVRRDLADYAAQWVVTGRLVVAVRGDDDGAAAGDSAGQVTEPVERGIVGSVQVLQDDHGELSAALSSSRKTANSSRRSTSAAHNSTSRPPTSTAISYSGPSGWGVKLPSHAPHHQRRSGWSSRNASTSDVLPTPASPATSTNRPEPDAASFAYSSSVRRKCPRSKSSTSGVRSCSDSLRAGQRRGGRVVPAML